MGVGLLVNQMVISPKLASRNLSHIISTYNSSVEPFTPVLVLVLANFSCFGGF